MIETQDIEVGEGVIRIWTLARPPANALNAAIIRALQDAAESAAEDPTVRAVILRGNARFFSGGLDLKEMAAGGAADVASFGYGDGVGALWTLPKPTIAQIEGHAIAGGAILALACDFRVCAEGDQKIGLNETAIGLAFPTGAFEIARRVLDPRFVNKVLLAAELFKPADALRVGLVDEVVKQENLQARCVALATQLAAYPPDAYAYNKALAIGPAVEWSGAESEEEAERRLKIWTSEETTRAFLARAQSLGKKKD